ncbi:MAG: response regulator [Verrucomicrobiota bacterium]
MPDRVLLVDDTLTNLQVLSEALAAEGYELLVAQSGEEALDIAKETRPQLILLDINMPGIDGYETCRRLKADDQTADAVIVFLSARGHTEDKIKGLNLGAADYIEKPFQFEEVVARVRTHLDSYHRLMTLKDENAQLKDQTTEDLPDLSESDIQSLVAGGETDRVEFKSTLRWNLHTDKSDKRMENSCLKTVAAYLNSRGGTLLVGVDDEGVALGLDKDQFANEDKLLLHWNALFKKHVGVEFAPFIRSDVLDLDGKRILAIQCRPSKEPVFFRRENDEIFYIRAGNGTQQLTPSEVLAYINQRIPK